MNPLVKDRADSGSAELVMWNAYPENPDEKTLQYYSPPFSLSSRLQRRETVFLDTVLRLRLNVAPAPRCGARPCP